MASGYELRNRQVSVLTAIASLQNADTLISKVSSKALWLVRPSQPVCDADQRPAFPDPKTRVIPLPPTAHVNASE